MTPKRIQRKRTKGCRGLAEVIEALEDARKFIRGGHSTISYGPMALVEKIDAALATLRSLEYIDNAKKNTKTKN